MRKTQLQRSAEPDGPVSGVSPCGGERQTPNCQTTPKASWAYSQG